MTVGELIEALQEMPDYYEATFRDAETGHGYDIASVGIRQDWALTTVVLS